MKTLLLKISKFTKKIVSRIVAHCDPSLNENKSLSRSPPPFLLQQHSHCVFILGECFDKLIKSFKVWCETALIQFLIEQYVKMSLILSSIKRDFKIRLGLFILTKWENEWRIRGKKRGPKRKGRAALTSSRNFISCHMKAQNRGRKKNRRREKESERDR